MNTLYCTYVHVAVLKAGVVHLCTYLVQFCVFLCVIFAISHHTSFFIFLFGHTIRKSFMYLHVHQTVVQLPPLTSFCPPPWHCYSVRFSLCRHSRWDHCHVDIVSCPQHLLEILHLLGMYMYTVSLNQAFIKDRCLVEEIQYTYMYDRTIMILL